MVEIYTLSHTSSGASAKISSYGCTLISYKDGIHKRENLFVSETAVLDGSKPVRGGIPIVFPIFGPPDVPSTMPQHGYTRRNEWTPLMETKYDNTESAGITYELPFSNVKYGLGEQNEWANQKYNCTLQMIISITSETLTTTLVIKNIGTTSFPFQSLFHTYYQIDNHSALSSDQCYVNGLDGYSAYDQLSKITYLQNADPITISSETDRIYTPPKGTLNLKANFGVGSNKIYNIVVSGVVDQIPVPISCVVWNPHKDKAEGMSDFKTEQYVDMLCVEPGILGNPVLDAGKEAKMVQVLKVTP